MGIVLPTYITVSLSCDIWEMIHTDLSPQMQKAMSCAIQSLHKSNLSTAQYLMTGIKPEGSYRWGKHGNKVYLKEDLKRDINQVVNVLIADAKGDLKSAHDQIIVLSRVVEHGNTQQLWDLALPPIPTLVQREKNPIQRNNFKTIQPARMWEATILQTLHAQVALSDKASIGRILCSAMFRSGLLQNQAINTFLRQIHEPILVVNDMSFIELSLRKLGQEGAEKRRLFLDPCTEALMLHHEAVTSDKNQAWSYIKSFLQEAGVEPALLPKNMTELIAGAASVLHVHIPPFLIGYAQRKIISHSLKSVAWLRLNHVLPKPGSNTAENILSNETDKQDDALFDQELDQYGRATWQIKLYQALKADTSKLAQSRLKALQDDPEIQAAPSICKYMLGWSSYLLQHGTKTSKTLKPARVRSDVCAILPRIYGFIADDDLMSFNIEGYEEIYMQILEGASSSNMRKKLANRLREFHYFMHKNHGAEEVEGAILACGNTISEVDANIISIEEYRATLKHLDTGPLNFMFKDLPLIAQLIVIISFRCGLRRSEVLKLRLIDIQGTVNPEIILRPHATRQLKTGNSTRRVLISYLLEDPEKKMLLNWVEKRRQQEKEHAYSPFIFCIPEMNIGCLSANMIFTHIHTALRQVTGDKSLRFHHFRHSCASWGILRLMVADHGTPAHFFDHMLSTQIWLVLSKSFKKSVYHHDQPTRKHLYAITNNMGHSSPDMTLEHYIHWCDILLKQALSQVYAPLNAKHWQNFIKMPKATAHRLVSKGDSLPILKKIRSLKKKGIAVIQVSKTKPYEHHDLKDNQTPFIYIQILQAWEMLYLHSKLEMTAEHLVERYSFPMHEVKSIIKVAELISALTTNKGTDNYRHRMLASNVPNKRFICPCGIKGEPATLLAKDYLLRLYRFMQENASDCHWFVEYYMNHSWHNSNDLIFRNKADANKYLGMLYQLNIHKKYIQFIWYHGKKIAGISSTERVQYWKSGLNLAINRPVKRKKLDQQSNLGQYGWFAIRINDYVNTDLEHKQGNSAFRFSMVMFSILCKGTGIYK